MSEATVEEAPQPKLAYELELDIPGLPKGELVQIPGLGTYQNGSTNDITQDEANSYRNYHAHQKFVYGEAGEVLGAESTQGPTLLQASKAMNGVQVSVYGKQPAPNDSEAENEGGDK